MTSKLCIFFFYIFLCIFPFLYFLFFWGRQGYCPCSYVSLGAMRKLDLRSSLSLNICWITLFLCILAMVFKLSFSALYLSFGIWTLVFYDWILCGFELWLFGLYFGYALFRILVGYDCLDYILFTTLYYLLLIPTNFGFFMLPKREKNGVAKKLRRKKLRNQVIINSQT